MLNICYLILGLLAVLPYISAITVETTVKTTGPSVCITSSAVVTKYVNVMCEHRGILYIGGQVNMDPFRKPAQQQHQPSLTPRFFARAASSSFQSSTDGAPKKLEVWSA